MRNDGRAVSDPTVYRSRLPKVFTYIGYCCREWILAAGYPVGSCGLCGERPTYLREDDGA